MRAIWIAIGLMAVLPAQRWSETCGRSPAGAVALQQALADVRADALVLLVASHPDDRYVLPAAWLRSSYGFRVAVLLATRGGGGQNSLGPETGDELERIRTLETEAGCAQLGIEAWYLNRTDGGYRRSAAETFAEWGRDSTLRELVRLLRTIRPDAVLSTHNREESHGHDLALVELLPEAVRLAADPNHQGPGEPHAVTTFMLGAGSTPSPNTITIDVDRLEPHRGATLRRVAHDVLRRAHLSPGAPGPLDAVFDSRLRFEPEFSQQVPLDGPEPLGLKSLFHPGIWPGEPQRAVEIGDFLDRQLPRRMSPGDAPKTEIVAVLVELRALAKSQPAGRTDVSDRLFRRIEALERLLLLLSQVQLEMEMPPGTVAIAGEEFMVSVSVHTASQVRVGLRAKGLDGLDVALSDPDAAAMTSGSWRTQMTVRVPRAGVASEDPMAADYRGDRFVPPVRIRFDVQLPELEVPVTLALPVERRPPVELSVVPRMLLLPSGRKDVQFSIGVLRNSQFRVEGALEVRAPAGYALPRDRQQVVLTDQRSDLFSFDVAAPPDRKTGVDVLRIRFGVTKITLPVHKIDVVLPSALRIGLLRSRDDTLPSVLGAGGLGVAWAELTDADLAVGDLSSFDTIVVDIRALRERPVARRGFRRLLEFATGKARRLLIFYQKDVEFHPDGEAFLGAPFAPFQVGRARVTRPDAPVRVLKPDHVLLRHPNPIRPADWDGWEQERALYLPSVYASSYEELIEIEDPGESPQRGSILYCRTGDGEYVYCALALWRQLKKLHPGAVRLLANLLTPANE